MLEQAVQIFGSLVLAAFIANQRGWLAPTSRIAAILNMVGSGVLAVDAALTSQWGFLLLEGAWAVVSTIALITAARRRPSHGADRPAR